MTVKTSSIDSREMGLTVAPTWGMFGDQALRLEELQAFAHRDRAHLEPAGQLVDHEAPARARARSA